MCPIQILIWDLPIALSLQCTYWFLSLSPATSGVSYFLLFLCPRSVVQTLNVSFPLWAISLKLDLCFFPSLSAVAVDTRPPSVCQVSWTATRCDLSVSSWIWRVPHQQPQQHKQHLTARWSRPEVMTSVKMLSLSSALHHRNGHTIIITSYCRRIVFVVYLAFESLWKGYPIDGSIKPFAHSTFLTLKKSHTSL